MVHRLYCCGILSRVDKVTNEVIDVVIKRLKYRWVVAAKHHHILVYWELLNVGREEFYKGAILIRKGILYLGRSSCSFSYEECVCFIK